MQNSKAFIVGLVSLWWEVLPPFFFNWPWINVRRLECSGLLEPQRPELWGCKASEKNYIPSSHNDYLSLKLRYVLLWHPCLWDSLVLQVTSLNIGSITPYINSSWCRSQRNEYWILNLPKEQTFLSSIMHSINKIHFVPHSKSFYCFTFVKKRVFKIVFVTCGCFCSFCYCLWWKKGGNSRSTFKDFKSVNDTDINNTLYY